MVRNKLYFENRIALLKSRSGRENARIIKKLQREIRLLEK